LSKIREQVLRANDEYANGFGDKSKLALPPARQFSILTCMDARIDPAKLAGLREGDAHVIRNAGGTREWFVIHHSNCGMELFNDQIIRGLLASSLETSSYDGKTWKDSGRGKGSAQGEFIDWLTIENQAKSVALDVERIKNHPLVPKSIPVYGYVYQVETGRLLEIPEATEIGRAT
jgi:carbonic anhydrase